MDIAIGMDGGRLDPDGGRIKRVGGPSGGVAKEASPRLPKPLFRRVRSKRSALVPTAALTLCASFLIGSWPKTADALGGAPISVQLAGGLVIFPSAERLNTGAGFGLGIGWKPFRAVGFEVGYLGAAFTEERAEAGSNVVAVESGGYAAVLYVPFEWTLAPYVLGGAGLSHRRIVGEEAGRFIHPGTFARLPVGVGVELRLGLFTLGLRGTYDFVLRSSASRGGGSPRRDDEVLTTLRVGALF